MSEVTDNIRVSTESTLSSTVLMAVAKLAVATSAILPMSDIADARSLKYDDLTTDVSLLNADS